MDAARQMVWDLFVAADVDQDQRLKLDELIRAFARWHIVINIDEARHLVRRYLVRRYDTNRDGRLDFPAFARIVQPTQPEFMIRGRFDELQTAPNPLERREKRYHIAHPTANIVMRPSTKKAMLVLEAF